MFPSMNGGNTAASATAPYPQSGYPASAFYGGTLASASPGANAPASRMPTSREIWVTVGTIAVIAGVGYAIFHGYYK